MDDWADVDALLMKELKILAIKTYREKTGYPFRQSVDDVHNREAFLKQNYPEKMKTYEQYSRDHAFELLESMKSPVISIKGHWRRYTSGYWFIQIVAITSDVDSVQTGRLEHELYTVSRRGQYEPIEILADRATVFGSELARSIGVEFSL